MKSDDFPFDEISHDCSIYTRVKVDPPYAFMELELEDGTVTGDATATLTEEGMEKLIEYLRQTLDDFRAEVNKHVDKGMRFSPRPTELHSFKVDFTPKDGAIVYVDEKQMRLSNFKVEWDAGGYPIVHVSFVSGEVSVKFPDKTLPPWEEPVKPLGNGPLLQPDHSDQLSKSDEITNGEKEDGTKL